MWNTMCKLESRAPNGNTEHVMNLIFHNVHDSI